MRVVIMATIVQVRVCVCVCQTLQWSRFYAKLLAKLLARLATHWVYTHWVIYLSLVVYSSVTDLRCAIGFH